MLVFIGVKVYEYFDFWEERNLRLCFSDVYYLYVNNFNN